MLVEPGIGALFFLTPHALKAWPRTLFQIKFHTSLMETAQIAKG